jgi:hypothetical protein
MTDFTRAHDEYLHRGIDAEPCAPCAECEHESTDLDADGLCPSCREAAAEAAELDADPTFAEVCEERRAAWIVALDSDAAAEAAMPWGPQWTEADALPVTLTATAAA